MNKRYFVFTHRAPSQELLALALTALFFAGGCIIGTVSAKYIDQLSIVPNYISSIITSLESGSNLSGGIGSTFLDIAAYPLVVFTMGFFVFGFIFIPPFAALRGYIYSFSVALIIRFYGISGILPALLLFGIKSLVLIPCFIFLAIQAFCASMQLTSAVLSRGVSGISPYSGAFMIRSLLCFAALALFAFLSYMLADRIFDFALNLLQKT